MNRTRTWTSYLAAYLLWALALALGMWLLLRARAVYPVLFGLISNEGEFQTRQIAMFADRAVVFFFGIAWVVLMVLGEHFLRTGVNKNVLWRNAARLFAALLLVLGITEAADLLIVNAGLPLPAFRWLYMLALLAGAGLLWWLGRRRQANKPGRIPSTPPDDLPPAA